MPLFDRRAPVWIELMFAVGVVAEQRDRCWSLGGTGGGRDPEEVGK